MSTTTSSALTAGLLALGELGFEGNLPELVSALGLPAPKSMSEFGRALRASMREAVELGLKAKLCRTRRGTKVKILPSGSPEKRMLTKVQELEGELIHCRGELLQAQKALRASAREGGLFRAIAREIEPKIRPFPALPPASPISCSKAKVREHLVVHLSDGHHDEIIEPHSCGGLEEYNFKVSCRRAEVYVDTIIKWAKSTLTNFQFDEVTVLAYGDHTSGEIHNAVSRSAFVNQFRNAIAIGQLHAMMFRDLASHFKAVNIVYVPGNHGRRSKKKDYHGAWDNWDYLVAETARMYCKQLENVSFLIPDSFAVNLLINGHGFQIAHGDDIRSNLGIPWYGLERRSGRVIRVNALDRGFRHRIRYFVCGHFHRPANIADTDGELIVNGAWVATTPYIFNSFSGYSEPCQLIHGVHEKYGITWRLPIQLRSRDENLGPKRYKIELPQKTGEIANVQ